MEAIRQFENQVNQVLSHSNKKSWPGPQRAKGAECVLTLRVNPEEPWEYSARLRTPTSSGGHRGALDGATGLKCAHEDSKRRWGTVIWADGAALSVWDDGVRAVRCVLADDVVAHHGAAVADADLAGLRFPNILVVVQLSLRCAAAIRA